RVVELAVALQRIAHVVETGPVLLEVRAEYAGPGMVNPGSDELAGLDLIGVREDVGGGCLRIACGGDAPRQIREILPHRRLVNAPGGPRMGMDVDQAGDDRLPGHVDDARASGRRAGRREDRKSTRLNSSHVSISYAVFCLKKKKLITQQQREDGGLA